MDTKASKAATSDLATGSDHVVRRRRYYREAQKLLRRIESCPAFNAPQQSSPALSTRAVREYLEGLDEEALAEAMPKRLSLTDPQSSWTAALGGPAFFAYSTNSPQDADVRANFIAKNSTRRNRFAVGASFSTELAQSSH